VSIRTDSKIQQRNTNRQTPQNRQHRSLRRRAKRKDNPQRHRYSLPPRCDWDLAELEIDGWSVCGKWILHAYSGFVQWWSIELE